MKFYISFLLVSLLCISNAYASTDLSSCDEITQSPQPGISLSNKCLVLYGLGRAEDQTALVQYAISVSASLNRVLYLSGTFYLSSPIFIRSNSRVFGDPSRENSVLSFFNNATYLINIPANVSNVSLRNLRIGEGTHLTLAVVLLSGRNTNIVFDDIDFIGRNLDQQFSTAGIFSSNNWIDSLIVRNSTFNNLESGITIYSPVWNLNILNNEITNWTDFGIYIGQGIGHVRRTREVHIIDNYIHQPRTGTINQPIIIARGQNKQLVLNVDVVKNRIVGSGAPYIRNDATSNATGDQIVLHGVSGFAVVNNRVSGGGENGITVSRLSRHGRINSNRVFRNDQNALNIGSGGYEMIVSNPENFSIGDWVSGNSTGTRSQVENIDNDLLVLGKIGGGSLYIIESLSNLTTQNNNASYVVQIDRTKSIEVRNNILFDNGLDLADSTPASQAIFLNNADSIDFYNNKIFNTNYEQALSDSSIQLFQETSIRCNNSRNLFFDSSNLYENGNETFSQAVFLNRSSWLRGTIF